MATAGESYLSLSDSRLWPRGSNLIGLPLWPDPILGSLFGLTPSWARTTQVLTPLGSDLRVRDGAIVREELAGLFVGQALHVFCLIYIYIYIYAHTHTHTHIG